MKTKYYDPFEYIKVQSDKVKNKVDNSGSAEKTEPKITKEKASAKRAYLIRVDNNERIVINKPVFSIGKSDSSNYVIVGNNAISRNHAEIRLKNNTVFVIDKKSTNKTYVNNVAVQPETLTKIVNGDKVKLANVEFVLLIE